MGLPRLVNVLAAYVPAPDARERCARQLRRHFPATRELDSGWLIAERPLSGSPPTQCADAAVAIWEGEPAVLASALHEAPITRCRARLPTQDGEFGFARFEEGGGFLAARSAGGLVPVYVARDANALWIGTSLEDVIRHRENEPKADELVQALWAEGNAAFPDGRTFFRDVVCIPRGHAAVGSIERWSISSYWDPRPHRLELPTQALELAHVREFRDTLLDSLSATLSREGLNLLTLSGGVDSSSLAFLARHQKLDVATLTFVAPRRSSARSTQLGYVQGVIDELGITQKVLVEAEDDTLEELFDRPLPALFFCPHPALRLLPELLSTLHPHVLFSGHFADEVSGASQRLQDWITHTSIGRLLDPCYAGPSGLRDRGRWLKRRTLQALGRPLLPIPKRIGPWFRPDLRAECREWADRECEALLRDGRPLRELSAWCRLDGWVAMHWECCSRLGVRPSHPFFSRSMLELAYRCHPSELFGPGTKKILRRALDGLVPDRFLSRSDKGHWRVVRRTPNRAGRLTDPPGSVRALLADEYRPGRAPLTSQEDRALSQLVLFSRKLREVRHAPYGRDQAAPPPEGGLYGA